MMLLHLYTVLAIEIPLTMRPSLAYFIQPIRPLKTLLAIVLLLTVISSATNAQQGGSSVTQSVTVEVKPIAQISVTGNPNPLLVQAPTSSDDLSVSDGNTKYNVTTNLDNMKIVASINSKMPVGTRLKINLSSSKAASAGDVDISSAVMPVDVVTGIGRGSDRDQSISYTFSAGSGVNQLATDQRVVTLTLTD